MIGPPVRTSTVMTMFADESVPFCVQFVYTTLFCASEIPVPCNEAELTAIEVGPLTMHVEQFELVTDPAGDRAAPLQSVQLRAEDAATMDDHDPGAQLRHALEPEEDEYVPAAQF